MIGGIIGILIGLNVENYNKKDCYYRIIPDYGYKKFVRLNLDCIFNIKVVHIINVLILLLKKRSEVK